MLSLSMEVELAWGTVMNPAGERHSPFSGPERKLETRRLGQLLDICDMYSIPFSFDVVGHLLLEECDGHDAPHADWFEAHDPEGDVATHPLYYAPDLVDRIAESSTAHEICTHTFSHVPMDEVSEDVIRWEINQARSVHEANGYPVPTSFVSPQHRDTPLDLIRELGISTIRVPDRNGAPVDGYPEDGGMLRRLAWNFGREPPALRPERRDGLLHVFCSSGPSLTSVLLPMGRNKPHVGKRAVPRTIRTRVHQSYLRKAIRIASQGTHVHLWCHLWDLANEPQWSIVRRFLHRLGDAMDDGLSVTTLRGLDSRY